MRVFLFILLIAIGCSKNIEISKRNIASDCNLYLSTKLTCKIGSYPQDILLLQNDRKSHDQLVIYLHGNNDDKSSALKYNNNYRYDLSMQNANSDKLFVMPLSTYDLSIYPTINNTNFGASKDYYDYFVKDKKFDQFISDLEIVNGGSFKEIHIVSHSGGYRTIAGLSEYLKSSSHIYKLRSVILLDSAYGFENQLVELALDTHIRFISAYNINTETDKYNKKIKDLLQSKRVSFNNCKVSDLKCILESDFAFIPVDFGHKEIVPKLLPIFLGK